MMGRWWWWWWSTTATATATASASASVLVNDDTVMLQPNNSNNENGHDQVVEEISAASSSSSSDNTHTSSGSSNNNNTMGRHEQWSQFQGAAYGTSCSNLWTGTNSTNADRSEHRPHHHLNSHSLSHRNNISGERTGSNKNIINIQTTAMIRWMTQGSWFYYYYVPLVLQSTVGGLGTLKSVLLGHLVVWLSRQLWKNVVGRLLTALLSVLLAHDHDPNRNQHHPEVHHDMAISVGPLHHPCRHHASNSHKSGWLGRWLSSHTNTDTTLSSSNNTLLVHNTNNSNNYSIHKPTTAAMCGGAGGLLVSSYCWWGWSDPRTGPPPALLILAALTVTALIVHPDGFTWWLLRQIRNGLTWLLQSSSTCWSIVMNDFGSVLCTIVAASVFVALFGLAYVLHRTLRRKTPVTGAHSVTISSSVARCRHPHSQDGSHLHNSTNGMTTTTSKASRRKHAKRNNHRNNNNNNNNSRGRSRGPQQAPPPLPSVHDGGGGGGGANDISATNPATSCCWSNITSSELSQTMNMMPPTLPVVLEQVILAASSSSPPIVEYDTSQPRDHAETISSIPSMEQNHPPSTATTSLSALGTEPTALDMTMTQEMRKNSMEPWMNRVLEKSDERCNTSALSPTSNDDLATPNKPVQGFWKRTTTASAPLRSATVTSPSKPASKTAKTSSRPHHHHEDAEQQYEHVDYVRSRSTSGSTLDTTSSSTVVTTTSWEREGDEVSLQSPSSARAAAGAGASTSMPSSSLSIWGVRPRGQQQQERHIPPQSSTRRNRRRTALTGPPIHDGSITHHDPTLQQHQPPQSVQQETGAMHGSGPCTVTANTHAIPSNKNDAVGLINGGKNAYPAKNRSTRWRQGPPATTTTTRHGKNSNRQQQRQGNGFGRKGRRENSSNNNDNIQQHEPVSQVDLALNHVGEGGGGTALACSMSALPFSVRAARTHDQDHDQEKGTCPVSNSTVQTIGLPATSYESSSVASSWSAFQQLQHRASPATTTTSATTTTTITEFMPSPNLSSFFGDYVPPALTPASSATSAIGFGGFYPAGTSLLGRVSPLSSPLCPSAVNSNNNSSSSSDFALGYSAATDLAENKHAWNNASTATTRGEPWMLPSSVLSSDPPLFSQTLRAPPGLERPTDLPAAKAAVTVSHTTMVPPLATAAAGDTGISFLSNDPPTPLPMGVLMPSPSLLPPSQDPSSLYSSILAFPLAQNQVACGVSAGRSLLVHDNPFVSPVAVAVAPDQVVSGGNNTNEQGEEGDEEMDEWIEAGLEELGGRMIGSVLDF